MIQYISQNLPEIIHLLTGFMITILGSVGLYLILFYLLRSLFRKFERDIALVTLNISAYPALNLFIFICLKITSHKSVTLGSIEWLHRFLLGGIIVSISYWLLRLFKEVVIYYLKEYAETTEVMWDQFLIPLLEGVVPVALIISSACMILQFSMGFDLTGFWLALGGSAFVIGFAVKDVLTDFFSGIILLLDSPFRIGDVVRIESESGSRSQLGILQGIGIRVTHFYMFELHNEAYIPNNIMRSHKITNLSRPIEPVYFSTPITFHSHPNMDKSKRVMKEILQAHPDIVGNIDTKLSLLKTYYHWHNDINGHSTKKYAGEKRLLAEKVVNQKLDKIEKSLQNLVKDLQILEKGGLNSSEIYTIQHQFDDVLKLVGLTVIHYGSSPRQPSFQLLPIHKIKESVSLSETSDEQSLISLTRHWYCVWLEDPNILCQDRDILPSIWERKIDLLKKRSRKIYQRILNPLQEETRIDDYVIDLIQWLQNRFKQARSEWQEPEIRMDRVIHDMGYTYMQFTLNYYVDDIRLEDGERGIRVSSDIYQEIMHHLQDECQRVQNKHHI